MTSPVTIPFNSFIQIDKTVHTPVYLQIANQMINAIQRGFLFRGMKLPGTRILAKLLQVHRNTIVAAYDELESQGWIEVQPNKGSFILNTLEEKARKIRNYNQKHLVYYPSCAGFKFKQSHILDDPFDIPNCELVFNDGLPDVRLSQINQLAKLYSSGLKRKRNQKNVENAPPERRDYFKENLSNFLNHTRGLHISKDNIIITRSMEMGVYIATEILISPGDVVIVGKLSYFATNMIFQKAGAEILTVPIDEEGIDVEAVKKLCKKKPVRMLYLTPHHHYPTTVTLSAQRRTDLLELSYQYGFIILEDDYDYDFHYGNSRVLPLASADSHGMVVYIGSFGRSLAPGFRTGFIIAPQNLIMEMYKFLGIIDRQGDVFMEQVLGEMIEEGEIHRHLKKTSRIYQERRDHFARLLQDKLSDHIEFKTPAGGLAMWIKWDSSINLMKFSKDCLKHNISIPKSLLYQTKDITAMRLGFGSFSLNEMEIAINQMTAALHGYIDL
ncbi:MAG: PLP-dependent aminotransferase family protein [Flavobacteriaceae bacterium]|jgi:GntR family transcriptional regulator/MocR family aminotransferase|nr:PLP-dependent aminotransferase family protein [Flavobacteriaceae bacterium]